jgi:Na+-driven multidrug efflux pump
MIGAFWILACLHRQKQTIVVRNYLQVRPEPDMVKRIMWLSIPAGIENGMFQFGKLAIQSSVSTLGTTAIAAQAMTAIMENVNGIAGCGVGIGMMTVVGQCIGAGHKDQAVYYIKKLTVWAEIVVLSSCILTYMMSGPVVRIAGMEPEAAALCLKMVLIITIVKPLLWVGSFIPAYGFRAAGDVKFTMITSSLTMWLCRVAGAVFMIRVLGLGILSVWLGMFMDWGVRAIIYQIRFRKGNWMKTSVID